MKINGEEWKLVPVTLTEIQWEEWGRATGPSQEYAACVLAAPQPNLEAMVEGVAKVIYESRGLRWMDASDIAIDDTCKASHAVLKHLFGEG